MTSELRIALSLAAQDTVSLAVQGDKVPQGLLALQRTLLKLNEDDMEEFRRGVLDNAKLQGIVGQMNDWLLDVKLRGILDASIPPNGSRLRLVFVVNDEVRRLMAGLPFELLWHDTPDKPLVLRRDIQSIIYKLEKASDAPVNPAANNWPFRVLIVRANPPDLGGKVPEVAKLQEHILRQGAHFGPKMVQVDVLSSEAAINQPATWSAFREHLENISSDYNVLVYLGHGEVIPAQTGGEPVGQLFFESEDGGGHQPISSPQLARLLSNYPIPIVLLTGCLTGAEPAGSPARMRGGEQGVAQALVNSSEAGVQVAIGMRTELKTTAAMGFLRAFFSSLLKSEDKGNIDRAVWAARDKLFLDNPFPPSWAAPIVFRASEQEPAIDYLARPVKFEITPRMAVLLDARAVLWKQLPKNITIQGGTDILPGVKTALTDVEALLKEEAKQHGPVLMPAHAVLQPGQTDSTTVQLDGQLTITKLTGRILIGGDAAAVTGIAAGSALDPGAVRFLTTPNDRSFFELQSINGQPVTLQTGELLKVDIRGNQAQPNLYPITLDIQTLEPNTKFWPGDNILVIPRP